MEVGRWGAGEEMDGTEVVDMGGRPPAVMLRVLVVEGVRWCRRRGWEKPEGSEVRVGSGMERAEAEEVLDATDAFWAARRRDSSRVRRLTCR